MRNSCSKEAVVDGYGQLGHLPFEEAAAAQKVTRDEDPVGIHAESIHQFAEGGVVEVGAMKGDAGKVVAVDTQEDGVDLSGNTGLGFEDGDAGGVFDTGYLQVVVDWKQPRADHLWIGLFPGSGPPISGGGIPCWKR